MTKQKTTLFKEKDVKRVWHEIDASGVPLGRLATRVAHILRGKHKVAYSPHQDWGDYVVVKNVEKMSLSARAKKMTQKKYHRYSGYPGGLRTETLAEKFAKDPAEVLRLAVQGMLDDNRLRKLMLRRLKIVRGEEHDYPVKRS